MPCMIYNSFFDIANSVQSSYELNRLSESSHLGNIRSLVDDQPENIADVPITYNSEPYLFYDEKIGTAADLYERAVSSDKRSFKDFDNKSQPDSKFFQVSILHPFPTSSAPSQQELERKISEKKYSNVHLKDHEESKKSAESYSCATDCLMSSSCDRELNGISILNKEYYNKAKYIILICTNAIKTALELFLHDCTATEWLEFYRSQDQQDKINSVFSSTDLSNEIYRIGLFLKLENSSNKLFNILQTYKNYFKDQNNCNILANLYSTISRMHKIISDNIEMVRRRVDRSLPDHSDLLERIHQLSYIEKKYEGWILLRLSKACFEEDRFKDLLKSLERITNELKSFSTGRYINVGQSYVIAVESTPDKIADLLQYEKDLERNINYRQSRICNKIMTSKSFIGYLQDPSNTIEQYKPCCKASKPISIPNISQEKAFEAEDRFTSDCLSICMNLKKTTKIIIKMLQMFEENIN